MDEQNHEETGVFQRLLDQNPLALGLIALVIGALIGVLIPESRKEHELLGPTKDRLLDEAKDAVKDVAGRAGTVVATAQHAAGDALDKAQDAAKQAFTEAVDTVVEEAKHQGVPVGV